MNCLNDEQLIIKHFREKYYFSLIKIKKGVKKSPDFIMYINDIIGFYAELKTIDEYNFKEGARPDPVFNCIENKIHKSYKQLKSINSKHLYPNVLIILNKNTTINRTYLHNVVTGIFITDKNEANYIYRTYSDGRIKEEKSFIDLYIWINEIGMKTSFDFIKPKGEHYNSLLEIFNINPDKVKPYSSNFNKK